MVADLKDFDARRRFGKFGSTFVELERIRRSQKSKSKSNVVAEAEQTVFSVERENLYGRCCITRQHIRMYNILS